jgi:predicted nucleic acid-binding protein
VRGFVYIDSSIALAHLLGEAVAPPLALFDETLISSRLLEYETWVRIHRQGLGTTHGEALADLLSRIAMLEPIRPVVSALFDPMVEGLRTLDAIHLASMHFLKDESQGVRLATYDRRLALIAQTSGIELYPLESP